MTTETGPGQISSRSAREGNRTPFLCPASDGHGGRCLTRLPCDEHHVEDAQAGMILYGSMFAVADDGTGPQTRDLTPLRDPWMPVGYLSDDAPLSSFSIAPVGTPPPPPPVTVDTIRAAMGTLREATQAPPRCAPNFTIDEDGAVWDGWGPLRTVTHPDVPAGTAAIVGIDAGPIRLSKVDESDRAWDADMRSFRAEQYIAMQVMNVNRDAIRSFYGAYDAEPRAMLTIRYERSTRPEPPQRLPWSTARHYRAARRRYGRQLRAWKRAGRPTTPEQVHLPNVTIDVDPS